MRIDVLANTTAQRYRVEPALLGQMRRIAGSRAAVHATSSLAELRAAAASIASRGTDLVVLSGGDGTFMAGVTALAEAFGDDAIPRLAFAPAGTVATVARNWGVTLDPRQALREIVDPTGALGTTVRPTLRVTARRADPSAAPEARLGFIFGTGLVARFFDVYYAAGVGGYATAAKIVARVFAESFVGGAYAKRVLDPLPCVIEVDGARLAPRAWSLVCASVVRDLGLHMRVNYRAAEDPQRPHLVASALPSSRLGPRAPLVLLGRRIGGEGHFDDLVGRFVVRFDDEGPFVLDGDVLRAREVTVAAGPSIELLAPRRASENRR